MASVTLHSKNNKRKCSDWKVWSSSVSLVVQCRLHFLPCATQNIGSCCHLYRFGRPVLRWVAVVSSELFAFPLLPWTQRVLNVCWKDRRHSEYTCLCNYVTWAVSYNGVGGIINPRFVTRGVSPWSRYVFVTCNHRSDSDVHYIVPACVSYGFNFNSLHLCMFERKTIYSFQWMKGSV
jgi:hypothetical protein